MIICAEKPGNVDSADGFSVTATHDYTAVIQADIVIIPYWGTITQKPPQKLLEALTTAQDNGAQIVGLCLGTFVLGYAGLLKISVQPRTGSSNVNFRHVFQKHIWILTRCM